MFTDRTKGNDVDNGGRKCHFISRRKVSPVVKKNKDIDKKAATYTFGTLRTFNRSRWIADELDSASREGGATAVAMETRTGGLGLSGICSLCKDG